MLLNPRILDLGDLEHFTKYQKMLQLWVSRYPSKITVTHLGGSDCKKTSCNAEDPGSKPAWGRSPGEGNGCHSSALARRIPWTEELGRPQSVGSHGVGRHRAPNTFSFLFVPSGHEGLLCSQKSSRQRPLQWFLPVTTLVNAAFLAGKAPSAPVGGACSSSDRPWPSRCPACCLRDSVV